VIEDAKDRLIPIIRAFADGKPTSS
jgi:hypothetical protein